MHRKLQEGIDWVGCLDWAIRDFHSYETDRGATYNAYLVQDTQTALIDTVKVPFVPELLHNIQELTSKDKVDYVICNHAEPDHAGGIPEVMNALPNATLVCNAKCAKALSRHFNTDSIKIQVVASGETLSLGNKTLQFIDTPMLHWPESMFTYLVETKTLFSMDAFGQHYATTERFDDEVSLNTLMYEAKAYYATIVTPFARQVSATLDAAKEIEINMIAPSHGLIWRSHIPEIVDAYSRWAKGYPESKVVVLYDSMWESTTAMARALVDGASTLGVSVRLLPVRASSLTQVATEILDAAAVAVGTSTLNRGMMPEVAAVMTFLAGLRPTAPRAALAFGSYGWSAGGTKAVMEYMKQLQWNVVHEPIEVQFRPDEESLDICRNAGVLLAQHALDAVQQP